MFTDRIKDFIERNPWKFAKSMPWWPHEYLIRERVDDEAMFVEMVEFIHAEGYVGKWYKQDRPYYKEGGKVYWIMGFDVSETTVINRADEKESYEYRAAHETLPHQLRKAKLESEGKSVDMRMVY